jgi:C1A family cysteine protease
MKFSLLLAPVAATAVFALTTSDDSMEAAAKRIAKLAADNPLATFSLDAVSPDRVGGCYNAPSAAELEASAAKAPFTFTDDELRAARADGVSIDWRAQGAVTPVQQQHPFGTCWAFSMVAVTESVAVIQGKQPLTKLSEQMVVSCVPEDACGDNADVLWSWAFHNTGGLYQTAEVCVGCVRLCRNI